MKKLLYSLLLGGTILFGSCSDFTDLQPKGKNLLSTTDDLEMLLNYEYDMYVDDYKALTGDMITVLSNLPTLVNLPTKTRDAILISWDDNEMDKMAELTSNDDDFSDYYGIIGRIANPILQRVDEIDGDETIKKRLKCEALVLRAYFHYLLVNKFAKAYNPSTAATDPGIPYVTEDNDILQFSTKNTVEEVYTRILGDVDKAIELDALPETAVNRMRMSKACAYAVKALALISMQKYTEAANAANEALEINKTVNDYNEMAEATGAIVRPKLQCQEDLFFIYNQELLNAITPEAQNRFEAGHASLEKMLTDVKQYNGTLSLSEMYLGVNYPMTLDGNSGWNMQGMKTTHMYLVIAEAAIEDNRIDDAMDALDAIRVNRIDPSIYAPLKGTVTSKADAIKHLKQTSHGENIYSCYNFINRKRWNQKAEYKETFTREIDGNIYTLTPESPLWIFPFPQNAVDNNPNFTQNYKEL